MSHKHISITVISFLLCSIPVFRADAQGNTNDVGKTSEQSFFKESSSSSREPGAHGDFRGNFFSEDQFTNFLGMHFSRVKISDEKVIFVAQNEMTKAKYIKLYKATGKKLDKLKRPLSHPSMNRPILLNPFEAVSAAYWLTKLAKERGGLPDNASYSLPTLQEWHVAASGGDGSLYCYGNSTSKLAEYANFKQSGKGFSMPAGSFRPNAYGCYDMHGNMAEYCLNVIKEDSEYFGYKAGGRSDSRAHAVTSYSFKAVNLDGLPYLDTSTSNKAYRNPVPHPPMLGVRFVIVSSDMRERLKKYRSDFRDYPREYRSRLGYLPEAWLGLKFAPDSQIELQLDEDAAGMSKESKHEEPENKQPQEQRNGAAKQKNNSEQNHGEDDPPEWY